ncbi:UxaA family hydrolase [Lentisphaera profundi]|uniref:UxaA family hydrolase n=1 Tax=Lentisphaera profundi TaxID=1658616 RepID=A0ABY7VTM0_9BACT|nr:UxaA family hydrolase [Lentisphaera profundi]WDE97566.1 UxaA family hydrolase [Lentisphaera profundi]
MSNKIMKLHPEDNVAVLTSDLEKGTELKLEGEVFKINKELSLGDKIALSDLAKGSLIYKYGIAIGSTKISIAKGEWVHLHNMKSDYVATYVFDGSDKEK